MRLLARLPALAAALALASCYQPGFGECKVRCAGGTCPEGLTCGPDDFCHPEGSTAFCTFDAGPPDSAVPDARPDGPEADASLPDAAGPDAAPFCGDGHVDTGEECDDGNASDTDGCLSGCVLARCGDGVTRAGVEECDDGNTADGDGCSPTCQRCAGGLESFTWPTNGHCYLRVGGFQAWPDAEAVCETQSGYLATFTSEAERGVVQTMLQVSLAPYWIGLSGDSTLGNWTWVTGEEFSFAFWASNAPSFGAPACVQQLEASGKWSDGNCAEQIHPLCESEAPSIRTDDNHAYRFIYRGATWADARTTCAGLGGHLATIESPGEQNFLDGLGHHRVFWLGASEEGLEGTFTWVTGEPLGYMHWAGSQPDNAGGNENCLSRLEDGNWNDSDCALLLAYICESD